MTTYRDFDESTRCAAATFSRLVGAKTEIAGDELFTTLNGLGDSVAVAPWLLVAMDTVASPHRPKRRNRIAVPNCLCAPGTGSEYAPSLTSESIPKLIARKIAYSHTLFGRYLFARIRSHNLTY